MQRPCGRAIGIGRPCQWSYTLNNMNPALLSEIQGRIRRGCVHAAAVFLLLLPAAGHASPIDQQVLVDQLRTDYAAMVSAEHEYRAQRERGALNEREADEYAAYVARLYRRVAEDCRSVQQAGISLPADVVCPTLVAVPMPAGIELATEQTRGEVTGALDAELMAGLGEFDEMLLREQERVKASAPRTDTGNGGGGGASGGDTEGGSGDAGEGMQTEGEAAVKRAADGGTTGGGRGGGAAPPGSWNRPGGSGGQPEDIPDGSDDDVVARQLREAAEKETDPELKKKLWEEYRKYKQGTR